MVIKVSQISNIGNIGCHDVQTKGCGILKHVCHMHGIVLMITGSHPMEIMNIKLNIE